MKKLAVTVLMVGLFISSSFAIPSFVSEVAKTAAKEAVGFVVNNLGKFLDNSEVIISNSDIINHQNLRDSWIIGSNTGISVIGNKINISNTDLKNNVILKNSFLVLSNAGIEIKSNIINLQNSTLNNDVFLQNAKVILADLGIKIGNM